MSWELRFATSDGTNETSRHDTRSEAITALTGHLVEVGISMDSDPHQPQRDLAGGDFDARFAAPDGTVVAYTIRFVQNVNRYLSLVQVEERLGLNRGSLSKTRMPQPDIIVGPVDIDGQPERGSTRGWLPETIDQWNATRPGRGARTDLRD